MKRVGLTIVALCLFALPYLVWGQEFRATLSGRITDSAGAMVPLAKITVRSADKGETFATLSGQDGSYQVSFLTPGSYVVTVERTGFKTAIREGVNLQIAQHGVVDITLAVGEVDQSVTVMANANILETETADRGLTIEPNRVLSMPLQGRNPFSAAWSAPGVIENAAAQRLRPFDIAGSSSMVINGGRPSTNEILVDGVSSLSQASSASYVPTAEAVGEFRVQNTNFDAQYGWTLGGVVNMITKSGSNEFHGSLFEFLQNTHLNANTFNQNLNGVPRQSSHINTLGGDVSGPVKKNKLFFTYTFEDIRQVIPDPFATSVPTSLQRQGNFSQTYYSHDSSGNPLMATIYDPFSTTTGVNGALVRTPFTGNVIPGARLDPVAVKVLSIVPPNSAPGDPLTGLNNLSNNGSTRKFTDFFPEHTGRGDYNINDTTRLFVRYSRNALQEERSFHYSTNAAFNPADTGNNDPFTRENHNATVQFTKTLNAATVLDIRLGFERFKSESGSDYGANAGPSSLGFSPAFVAEASNWFPKFNWASYEGAGAQPSYTSPISQLITGQATLARTFGRHSAKFGGELRVIRGYSQNPGFNAGNFSFDPTFTGANPLSASPSSGNSIASFLLGTPQSGYIQVNSQPARQERMSSLFVQDDIRLLPKLKLNLGLRWDYISPMTDRFNELGRGFDTSVQSPLQAAGLNLTGGLLFAGAGGQSRGIFDPARHNFGPRAGLAYELGRRTVLRGGYALVYGQTWYDPGNAPGFSQNTNMVTSIQAGLPANTLDNPFPSGILTPVGSSLGLKTALGQGISFADPAGGQPPYVHQFSFEIQHELPRDFLVTAAYVGSRSRDIAVSQQLNALPLEALSMGSAALTASVPNPLAGLIPGTSLNGATIQRQQLLVRFPQFLINGVTEQYEPIGRSSYNGAQFLVSKRLSYGLNFSVAYTISKQMDQTSFANPQYTGLEKAIASWDIPQNVQINFSYELPFGIGRAIGGSLPRPVRALIGGWQVSSLTRLQKGMPLAFPANAAPTGLDPALPSPSYYQWLNTCTLLANGGTRGCLNGDQPAWTVRQPFTLQTWSSRLSHVRTPGIHNVDFSIIKHNRITERFDLIFRADFVNGFNSPQFFGGPINDVNNANFGRIAGAMEQSNLPRFVQVSMKLRF